MVALGGGSIPLADEIGLDTRVLAFTTALAVVAGLFAGLAPAMMVRGRDVRASLHGAGARGATSGRRQLRLRAVMVATQVALSIVLLVGAGLLLQSFARLASVAPGTRTDLLTFRLDASSARYDTDEAVAAFYRRVEEELQRIPSVRGVAFSTGLPMTEHSACGTLFAEEAPERFMREDLCAEVRAVSSGYFSVMGVPVEAGRGVDATDAAETEPVVVINRRTAEILWPGQDPLGHRLATGLGGDDLRGFRLYRVVGVVPDVKQFNLHEPAPPQTYLPLPQWPRTARSVVLDVSDEPARVVPSVREAVWRVDSELPITEVGRIDELVSATMAQPRLRTVLVAIFAGLALVLALVGLYGVVSYSVGSRRRELALRLAMGARRGRLLRLVLQRGLRPVFPGMALGLLGALALSTTLESFLFEVSTKDPLPYVVVPALMLVVAIVASLVPARTGVRIDPATTLREE